MTLNHKFLAQMRAATRSRMRRGPAVARTVIRESVKNAAAVQTAAVNSMETVPPPASNNPTTSSAFSGHDSAESAARFSATVRRFRSGC